MADELEDARLLIVALERLSRHDPAEAVSWDEMNAHLGLTEKDLAGWENTDLE